ncbi:MAG: BamA/OMP85 family outer membrane protein [Gemmatimonadota bacterium]
MRAWRALLLPLGLLLHAADAQGQGIPCDRGMPELRRLDFNGNRTFRDDQLANIIRSTQSSSLRRTFRIVGPRFCLDSLALSEDSLRLVLFHYTQGFRQVEVGKEIRLHGPTAASVTFTINEGEPIIVDSLAINGLEDIENAEAVRRSLPLRLGGRYARDAAEDTRDSLARRLRNSGYATAEVLRNVDFNDSTHRAAVWYDVLRGPRMRIDSVSINVEPANGAEIGVSSRAVRRALGIGPSAWFSQQQLEEIKRGLYLSGAYQHVNLEVDSASLADEADSLVQVNVTLRETEMHEARASIGWGNLECLRMQGTLATRNFLGGLRRVDVSARLSRIGAGTPFNLADGLCYDKEIVRDARADTLNYYLGVTYSQPALFGRRTLPTVTLYSEFRYNFPTYVREVPIGVVGSIQRNAGGVYPSTFSYSLEYGRTGAEPAYFCAVFNVCEESGRSILSRKQRTAIAGWSMTRLPPNPTNPTRSWGGQVELRHASKPIGSDPLIGFTRASLDLQWYTDIGDGAILVLRARGGTVLGSRFSFTERASFVPPQERLYAGGANTVRGYGANELGPIVYIIQRYDTVPGPGNTAFFRADPANTLHTRRSPDQPTGGDNIAVTNAELRLRSPIYPELVQYALFVDAGEVWNRSTTGGLSGFESLKITPGAGLRVFTPIGPIRVDLALGPRDLPSGPAYFSNVRNAAGQQQPVYCLSPGNELAIDLSVQPAAQQQGDCPGSYAPPSRRSFFGRLRFHFSIGQAF